MIKKIILLIGVVFLLIAIPITFFVAKQQQEIRQKAAPATRIYLSPSQKTVKVGDTFTLDVNIDTGENNIVGARVELNFDPSKFQPQSIVNSSQFPNILSSADLSQQGKAIIAVGTSSINKGFEGVGTLATVRFSVIESSNTPLQITFGPNTFAGSIAEGSRNAIIGTNPAIITIHNNEESGTQPSPTPNQQNISPNISPTISIIPTSSISPTNTMSPTISPTTKPGQLSLTSHANNASTNQDPPTLSGKAPPKSIVTITFYPGSLTEAVSADTEGNWSFTPKQKIGIGTYTITITSTNPTTGATQSITSTLIISSSVSVTPTKQPNQVTITPTQKPSNQQEIPITGVSQSTYSLTVLAILFIVIGIILPFYVKN